MTAFVYLTQTWFVQFSHQLIQDIPDIQKERPDPATTENGRPADIIPSMSGDERSESSEPIIFREVKKVLVESTQQEIEALYRRLRSTLELVGITPEQAPFIKENQKPPYHFIGLAGYFHIAYQKSNTLGKENLLIVRITDKEDKSFLRESYDINPQELASYVWEDRITNKEVWPPTRARQSGFLSSLGTIENESYVIENIIRLTDTLQETINKDEHQPEAIEQKVKNLSERTKRKFSKDLKRRKKMDIELESPVGRLNGWILRPERSEITIYLAQIEHPQKTWGFWSGGGVTVTADNEEGRMEYQNGQLIFRDPHYVLMMANELEKILGLGAS